MIAIFKRELKSYFYTPSAYVFLTVMMFFFSLFFIRVNLLPNESMYGMTPATANFSYVMDTMKLIMVFVIPVLTMRLISEERRQKTDQLLHTSPITTIDIVLAKFLSAMSVFSLCMVVSMIYPLMIRMVSGAASRYLVAVYIGIFLLGACYIAICVFASSLAENQAVAGFLGFFFILVLWLIDIFGSNVKFTYLSTVIDWLSLIKRFSDFASGTIKISAVVYYLSMIIIFLFLTVRTIDKRRWTEG